MSVELTYLVLTALLAASMWIPYIIGVNMNPVEGQDDFLRPPDLSAYPAWVHRAHRAHLNLVEQAVPFAIVVLIASLLDVSTQVTVWAAAIFFWLRVAHAAGMISGTTRFPSRSIIFTGGWLAILAIGIEVLRA